MLKSPSFRRTYLPILLIGAALIFLNIGLYLGLGSQPREDKFALPYTEDFADVTENPYEEFGGDWEIRDERLIQLDTNGYDLTTIIPLTIPEDTAYRFGTTLQYFGGLMGGGMMFNAQQITSRQQSHMVRFNVDGGQLWLIYGYFGDDSDFIGQGSAQLDIASDDNTPQRLELDVQTDSYSITLNGQRLAQDIPLNYVGGAVGFISSASQMGFDDVSVMVLEGLESNVVAANAPTTEPIVEATTAPAPTEIIADNMVTEGDIVRRDTFDDTESQPVSWQPISGNWLYQDDALVQTNSELFDLTNVNVNPITYPITYQATFRHLEGVGGGIVFNMPAVDSKQDAYMVRYFSDADVVAWGYFDAEGVFNGVGSSPVSPPETGSHTLSVNVKATTFDIMLDGQMLATDVPLHLVVSPSHYALTTSQSAVAFDETVIYATVAPEVAATADVPTTDIAGVISIDDNAVSGDWTIESQQVIQSLTEPTDYLAGTGLAGEQYSLTTQIQFISSLDDVGAGIVLHMADRNSLNLGYLIRFADRGKNIFWGKYDENGVFSGMGFAELNENAVDSAVLKVVVNAMSLDIYVDDRLISEAVPLDRTSGWIGLMTYRGAIAFSSFDIQVGEQ